MTSTPVDPTQLGGPGLRAFRNIAELWSLSPEMRMRMLGIDDLATFEDLDARAQAHEQVEVPFDVLMRISSVLSIYSSLVTLLSHERSAKWIRTPNMGSLFGGRSALALMTGPDPRDLDRVAGYLLGQIHC